jgi:hypothetical protein
MATWIYLDTYESCSGELYEQDCLELKPFCFIGRATSGFPSFECPQSFTNNQWKEQNLALEVLKSSRHPTVTVTVYHIHGGEWRQPARGPELGGSITGCIHVPWLIYSSQQHWEVFPATHWERGSELLSGTAGPRQATEASAHSTFTGSHPTFFISS